MSTKSDAPSRRFVPLPWGRAAFSRENYGYGSSWKLFSEVTPSSYRRRERAHNLLSDQRWSAPKRSSPELLTRTSRPSFDPLPLEWLEALPGRKNLIPAKQTERTHDEPTSFAHRKISSSAGDFRSRRVVISKGADSTFWSGRALARPSAMNLRIELSTNIFPFRFPMMEFAVISYGLASSGQSTYVILSSAGTGNSLARVASNVGVSTDNLGVTLEPSLSAVTTSNKGLSDKCHLLDDIFPKNCAFAPGSATYAAPPISCSTFASACCLAKNSAGWIGGMPAQCAER